MILWLASYPRSGNTLCRLIMHRCFGLGSYSDQGNGFERPVIGLGEDSGLLEYSGEWSTFYNQAAHEPTLNLIKTHQHPSDDHPAIVIVRDPRSSLCSYFHYLRKYWLNSQFSLAEIVRGDVFYGGWQEFYGQWLNRPLGSTLLLYFDELANLQPATLKRISTFTGATMRNQQGIGFDTLKNNNPDFFRSGKLKWEGDPHWTPEIEELFQERFAATLSEYGFA